MTNKEFEEHQEYAHTFFTCKKCGIGSMFNSRVIETGIQNITMKELYCDNEECFCSIPCGINNLTLKQYP